MSRETEKQDRLVHQGVTQFMNTLKKSVATHAIVITIQPDGYAQLHSNVDEPEHTELLMKIAGGDRLGRVLH